MYNGIAENEMRMDELSRPSPKGNAQHDGTRGELDFVIENMRQGLWRLNPFGIILYANPYLAEWLESTPDQMEGKHFSRYRSLRPVSNSKVESSLSQRYEAEFITTTGITRRAIVVTSPAVDSRGEATGTIDLITDITAEHAVQAKLVQEVQKMSQLASTDSLTGVANRHVFDRMLHSLIDNAVNEGFGLILMDMDHFKEINDNHGHEWGDRVLVQVADRIRSAVRDNDVVARIGGDEFAILLPNATKESVEDIIGRLRTKLRFRMPGNGSPIRINTSMGYSHSDDEVHSILNAADQEMYRRKHARRAKLA
jgi:diguanylate cyclase (GGDEF)-like protein